jgi:hypothetical protein
MIKKCRTTRLDGHVDLIVETGNDDEQTSYEMCILKPDKVAEC